MKNEKVVRGHIVDPRGLVVYSTGSDCTRPKGQLVILLSRLIYYKELPLYHGELFWMLMNGRCS